MDEQLKLAEAYYAVAAHLRDNGQRMVETADMLACMADRLCEQSMRRKKPSTADYVKLDADGNPVPSPSSASPSQEQT